MRSHLVAAALLLAATPAFAQLETETRSTTSTTTNAQDCTSLPTAAERSACITQRGTSGSSSVTTMDNNASATSSEIKQRTTTHKEGLFGSETDSKTRTQSTVETPDGSAQKETTTSTHTER